MQLYEFAVDLTMPDNTAFTVLTALRGLGYGGLERVERSDLLMLRMREGTMSPTECARALAAAEVVFNPNKHRIGAANGAGSLDLEAVVSDKDDDTNSLAALLSNHFGIVGLERVERATAWRLYEQGGSAPAARHEWACRSLLSNPFSQTYVVRTRPSYDFL